MTFSRESTSRFAQYFLRECFVIYSAGEYQRAHQGGEHPNRIASCGTFRSPGEIGNHLVNDGLYMLSESASCLRQSPNVGGERRHSASLPRSVSMDGAEVPVEIFGRLFGRLAELFYVSQATLHPMLQAPRN